jgi:hypothetical protein
MAMIVDIFDQAQLSLAAYAQGLQKGWHGGKTGQDPTPYALSLIESGMSEVQAIKFANTYTAIQPVKGQVSKNQKMVGDEEVSAF